LVSALVTALGRGGALFELLLLGLVAVLEGLDLLLELLAGLRASAASARSFLT
jgi:hypothetical protein